MGAQRQPEPMHVTPSDWASLIDTLASQQTQIAVLQTGHRTIVDQIAQVTVTLRRQDDAIQNITDSVRAQAKASAEVAATLQRQDLAIEANRDTMAKLRGEVAENTRLTQESLRKGDAVLTETKGLRDALVAGRFLRRAAIWVGVSALALAQWWDQIRTLLKLTKGGP